MNRLVLAALAAGIVLPRAEARVDETREQCLERYGDPVATDSEDNAAIYHKAGFLVKVYFYKGKCEWITIHKFAEGSTEKFQAISNSEIESFLAANAPGREWEQRKSRPQDGVAWKSTDGSLAAHYDPAPHWTLCVYTSAAYRRRSYGTEEP